MVARCHGNDVIKIHHKKDVIYCVVNENMKTNRGIAGKGGFFLSNFVFPKSAFNDEVVSDCRRGIKRKLCNVACTKREHNCDILVLPLIEL